MRSLRELLLLVRLGQAQLCASYCRGAIDRERRALEKALDAGDRIRGELRQLEHEAKPGVPAYLLKDKP